MSTRLPVPRLVDATQSVPLEVDIITTQYKFAPDAQYSGTNPSTAPIFASAIRVDFKTSVPYSFGLPFFRFKRGDKPKIRFNNKTNYTFNLHWHGLNDPADIDGASTEVEFGVDTKIGTRLKLDFPTIHNNSTMQWFHAHPMFRSSEFVYRGVVGLLNIVDDASKCVTDMFKYGDNHVMLAYADLDLDANGVINSANLYTDEMRACYGTINGVSCINWYSNDRKYTTELYHTFKYNLVKIDILNATCSFRYIYIGVCDKHNNIKTFYHIQSDDGLINPTPMTILSLGPANRVSILVNVDEARYVFLYNFDLTEVGSLYPNDTADVPVITYANPTPNPTPIPGSDSALTYPVVPAVPQVLQTLDTGNQPLPCLLNNGEGKQNFTIKKFLHIGLDENHDHLDIDRILRKIRQVVFGEHNYSLYKELIKTPNFELMGKINYLGLLNPKYYYNLPDFTAPTRNFILFGDDTENAATECINGANRIMTDMWNSDELDFSYAMDQYTQNPNNFKPTVLPTCLFKIFPSGSPYMNYQMLANDTLTIELFNIPVTYTTMPVPTPVASATVIFPSNSKSINIAQWVALVNTVFTNNTIIIAGVPVPISSLLSLDWTFYPYKISYLTNKVQYIKTAMMKLTNNSPYYVMMSGKWNLLQLLGKAIDVNMSGMSSIPNMSNMCGCGGDCKCVDCKCTADNKCNAKCTCDESKSKCSNCKCGSSCKCDGVIKCSSNCTCMLMNYDMNLQQMYSEYATNDPNSPITTYDNSAKLIILPQQVFFGFIDGFMNDSLMNFSVQLNSSEKWVQVNLDSQDTHPFHFHLTNGYVDAFDSAISPGLLKPYRNYLYANDVYGIPAQQSISYYLKFPNYVSEKGNIVKGLGYHLHCHYMDHHDSNMMQIYFVYEKRDMYF